METQTDSERFRQIVDELNMLPPGIDDARRNELLRELDRARSQLRGEPNRKLERPSAP